MCKYKEIHYSGTLVQWCTGTVVHRYNGKLVQWYTGAIVQWQGRSKRSGCSGFGHTATYFQDKNKTAFYKNQVINKRYQTKFWTCSTCYIALRQIEKACDNMEKNQPSTQATRANILCNARYSTVQKLSEVFKTKNLNLKGSRD